MPTRRSLCAGVLLLVSVTSTQAADDARGFYQGRTIQFVTMGSPGGGYDAYTRTIGMQLEKRLGLKSVTVNEPAAGGLVAMNRLLSAKPDGTTILLIGGEALATAQLFGEPGVNYDILKQTWLARVSAESKVTLMGPKSPYRSLQDMVASDRPVIWAGSGKTDGNTDFSAILGYAANIKTKLIIGYKGTGGMTFAMEHGEVDGRVISDESAALTGSASGMKVVSILARQRSEAFPDVPTVFESTKLNATGEKLLDWRAGIAALGRLILATPGTPPDRVALLRTTLDEILTDPAFTADVRKSNLSVSHANGDEVKKMVAAAMTTLDAKGLAEVKDIVIERFY